MDNYDYFVQHDAEQERWLRKRPICDCCKEHIQDEKALHIDGMFVCQECEPDFWDEYRKDFVVDVENYEL